MQYDNDQIIFRTSIVLHFASTQVSVLNPIAAHTSDCQTTRTSLRNLAQTFSIWSNRSAFGEEEAMTMLKNHGATCCWNCIKRCSTCLCVWRTNQHFRTCHKERSIFSSIIHLYIRTKNCHMSWKTLNYNVHVYSLALNKPWSLEKF